MNERMFILGFPWKHGRTPINKGLESAISLLNDEMSGNYLVRFWLWLWGLGAEWGAD